MNWINPGILAGFAALAIPIIIHFLRNLRYQKAELGSLRFLRLALKQSQRKRRLREILLLLARLAMVALLVMLFARPFLVDPDSEKGEREYVFLVDASGSLGGNRLGTQNFELIKKDAIKRLEKIKKHTLNSKITVAFFSDDIKEVKGGVQGIKDLKLKPAGVGNYTKALNWAFNKMKASDRPKRRIVMITDYQKAGMPSAIKEYNKHNSTSKIDVKGLENVPKDVLVEVQSIAPAGTYNIAVTKVTNGSPHVGIEGPITVEMETFGKVPTFERKIKVIVEIETSDPEKPIYRASVVPLDRRMFATFTWKPEEKGLFKGKVRIEPYQPKGKKVKEADREVLDNYPRDDQRDFVCAVDVTHPILLINGVKGKNRFLDETYFLNKALSVKTNKDLAPKFYTEVRNSLNRIEYYDLYQAIALCNVKSISNAQAAMLKEYVENGGGLIYFLGDQTQKSTCDKLARKGVFPAEYLEPKNGISLKLTKWSKTHPAFAEFRDIRKANLRRILFQENFIMEADEEEYVLAKLSSGAPAVIGKKIGKGYVMIVTESPRTKWSHENIFLPFVHEVFKFLSKNKRSQAGLREKTQGINEQRDFGYTVDKTTEKEIVDGKVIEKIYEDKFVIVPSALESDITLISPSSFRAKLHLGKVPEEDNLSGYDSEIPPTAHRDGEIWLYLILGILAIAAFENLLADRGEA